MYTAKRLVVNYVYLYHGYNHTLSPIVMNFWNQRTWYSNGATCVFEFGIFVG